MKKYLTMAAVALIAVIGLVATSCDDKEEGETWEDWGLRNTINGPAWHVDMLKNANGSWDRWENVGILYFNVKFSASNHNFSSEKFYYDENGEADETTREKYSSSDNTAYTITDGKIVEGTVGGQPYFRLTITKKPSSTMEGTLHFYRENKTYEVIMSR